MWRRPVPSGGDPASATGSPTSVTAGPPPPPPERPGDADGTGSDALGVRSNAPGGRSEPPPGSAPAPEAVSASAAASAPDDDDVDGPPPPPFVREREERRRRRRRRRRGVLVGVAALLLVAAAVGVVVSGVVGDDVEEVADAPEAAPEGEQPAEEAPREEAPSEDEEDDAPGPGEDAEAERDRRTLQDIDDPIDLDDQGRPDRDVPDDETISPPDLSRLDVGETRIAELLSDIDASERVMLGFQFDVRELVSGGIDLDDPDEVFAGLRAAGERGVVALELLRERMEDPQEDARAEEVREAYVVHLDSWVRYMAAVADDPQILLRDTSRYTVDINRTADLFVRATEELLETADLDRELRRYAEAIVGRGFPDPEDSQV